METIHAVETIEMALRLAVPEICNCDQGGRLLASYRLKN